MRRIPAVIAGTLATAAVLAAAAPANAKGPSGQAGAAGLTATPGVVTYTDSNAYETFTGCGYQPNTLTTIVLTTPSATSWFGGSSDSAGCISLSHNGFIDLPGTYYVQAWQDSARTGKSTMLAKTTFVVQA